MATINYKDPNTGEWIVLPVFLGPSGTYRHVQASAATTWTIDHNLAYRPNVTVIDSIGNESFPGTITHTSINQVVLTFSVGIAGEAYCS